MTIKIANIPIDRAWRCGSCDGEGAWVVGHNLHHPPEESYQTQEPCNSCHFSGIAKTITCLGCYSWIHPEEKHAYGLNGNDVVAFCVNCLNNPPEELKAIDELLGIVTSIDRDQITLA